MTTLRWGVLSTAAIGRLVIEANRDSPVSSFTAVASRDVATAQSFAAELGLSLAFGSYDELLASPEIDAVYVALPVSLHTQWTVRALQAGKHVLCEKPFALTAADAQQCLDAATAADRVCVEGFMWRHHPQTAHARRLVDEGAIGRLAYLRAALTVAVPAGDIRRSTLTGGGALGDLGCYCVSAARLFGGEPDSVHLARVLDEHVDASGVPVDLRGAAVLGLPDGVTASFDIGLDLPRRDELELIGTGGVLRIPDPWICRSGTLELVQDGRTQVLPVESAGFVLTGDETDAYRIEFDAVSTAILAGRSPAFGGDDIAAQARVLDALRLSGASGEAVTFQPTAAVS